MLKKIALSAALALTASACQPAGDEAANNAAGTDATGGTAAETNLPDANQQAAATGQPVHKVVPADQVSWGAGPPTLPAGAQAAVLHGDPSKDGMFVMRLKMPAGYAIPPHTHPKPEIVTVISGAFNVGMGNAADRGKAQRLASGSFFAFDPGLAHYAHVDEETVVQISSTGPWGIEYVNPADDPRKTQ